MAFGFRSLGYTQGFLAFRVFRSGVYGSRFRDFARGLFVLRWALYIEDVVKSDVLKMKGIKRFFKVGRFRVYGLGFREVDLALYTGSIGLRLTYRLQVQGLGLF